MAMTSKWRCTDILSETLLGFAVLSLFSQIIYNGADHDIFSLRFKWVNIAIVLLTNNFVNYLQVTWQ